MLELDFKKYHYGDDEVVVFIDESGDELLGDPKNPIFVWGCCFVLGKELPELRNGWLAVREEVLGDPNKPLHMREHSRRLRGKKEDAVCRFFEEGKFRRASVAITDKTVFKAHIQFRPVFELSLALIRNLIAKLLSGAPCHGASFVFERSIRHQSALEQVAQQNQLRMDGVAMPVAWAFLPKDASEPALEIADFVAHTTTGYERSGRNPNSKFARRYKSVFENEDYAISWRLDQAELTALGGKPVTPGESL